MDHESKKFGKGPKELTGALNLINYYKLLPHYEFFFKKSLHSSISNTHYLRNVVGDTEIRKGEGMQLNQLIGNAYIFKETNTCIQPFDLDVLTEAFYLRETAPIDLPASENGIPTQAGISKSEPKDKDKKHKKHKDKDREKNKEHKKHKHRHSKDKEKRNDTTSNHNYGADISNKPHEKKRKHNGDEDLNGIRRLKNSKHKSSKMDEFGAIRVAA